MLTILKDQGTPEKREDLLVIDEQIVSPDAADVALEALYVRDTKVAARILEHALGEWPHQLLSISLPIYEEDDEAFALRVWINLDDYRRTCNLNFHFEFDARRWKHQWTLLEYITEASSHISATFKEGTVTEYDDDVRSVGLMYLVNTTDFYTPLADKVRPLSEQLVLAHQELTARLHTNLRHGSVVSYFRFPEQVRVPCEQYLLYFTQFLRDVGVKADAELRSEAGRVLFSVTPEDGEQALDAIRRALDVYLELPAARQMQIIEIADAIEVQRLAANIQHLRGQLMLASAALQLKEATIEQQQITIHHQAALLSGSVMQDGLIRTETGGEREEIFGGTVAITKLEGKGFEVNLPEIFRRVRQLFVKKDT